MLSSLSPSKSIDHTILSQFVMQGVYTLTRKPAPNTTDTTYLERVASLPFTKLPACKMGSNMR